MDEALAAQAVLHAPSWPLADPVAGSSADATSACDPGNSQFNLLKSDHAVSFRPGGELFTWENAGPDDSWLCSNPTLLGGVRIIAEAPQTGGPRHGPHRREGSRR